MFSVSDVVKLVYLEVNFLKSLYVREAVFAICKHVCVYVCVYVYVYVYIFINNELK